MLYIVKEAFRIYVCIGNYDIFVLVKYFMKKAKKLKSEITIQNKRKRRD